MIRVLAVLALTASLAQGARPVLVHRDVYLMGTRARLAVHADGQDAGQAMLERALTILEQTDRELSTWRDDSDISRLNRASIGVPWRASAELCRLFADLYEWSARTGGTFDPGIGALTSAWKIHDKERGAIPSAAELDRARGQSGLQYIDFDRGRCTLTRRADVTIDVGAFGKGEALERVARDLRSTPWMIDLGGQVSVGGPSPPGDGWTIDIAHPVHRDQGVMRLRLRSGSISTSGNSERAVHADGVRIGHILDPRTGAPASFAGSVVVWHERDLVADILSTALFVMGPEAGLEWAEAHGIAVCYLIPDGNGVKTRMSQEFNKVTHI
jgi:thiamine biosynthesis lipoprotein